MDDDRDFERFFRAEQVRVLSLSLALCGDRNVAMDVTQESFVRAYRR